MATLIAITGGIGTGKSVICKILVHLGFLVYDCDSEAKKLMDSSEEIRSEIISAFGENIVTNNIINRQLLSQIVFNDSSKLQTLNAIVHSCVKKDILRWVKEKEKTEKVLFVETAILYTSGLDTVVSEVWKVETPIEERIRRVILRNNMERKDVLARIESQRSEEEPTSPHRHCYVIYNEPDCAVLPQVLKLLDR